MKHIMLMTWTSSAWPWRHRVDFATNQNSGAYIILSACLLFHGFMSSLFLWCKESTIYKAWHCHSQHHEDHYKWNRASHYSSSVAFNPIRMCHACLYPNKGPVGPKILLLASRTTKPNQWSLLLHLMNGWGLCWGGTY